MSARKYYKYPRTFHFLWSENLQNDDRLIEGLGGLIGQEVIVSLKLDGENTSLMKDHIHARSIDSSDHLSRHWIKALHASIRYEIPPGWRICGENMFALHSIYYTELMSYFYVFAIFDEKNISLSWNEVEEFSDLLGLKTVPVLHRGKWDEETIKNCYTQKSACRGWEPKENITEFKDFRQKILNGEEISSFANETQEGYVCRVASSFSYNDYDKCIAKFVRKSHVRTSDFWMTEIVIPNKLKEK